MVIHMTRQGEIKDSKPCQHCLDMLRKNGIRKIIYSNEHGNLVSQRVRDVVSKGLSRVYSYKEHIV
jgi:arginyl-tRNA--protein-N-Asp/Glu arginylyltransferase